MPTPDTDDHGLRHDVESLKDDLRRPVLKKAIATLDSIADWTGSLIAPLTVIMMLVTCIVVAARYLFGMGAIPLQEAVIYMHGVVFMLGIGYTLKDRAHVRVDVLSQRFSARTRAAIDLLGTAAFLLPVSGFIFWTSLDYVQLSWSMREGSAEPGGLPGLYLLKALIPAMAVLLTLQGIAEALRCISTLSGRHD